MLIDLERDECIGNEVNSLPRISKHLFPMEGIERNILRMIMDYYFPETVYKDTLNGRLLKKKKMWDYPLLQNPPLK